jgi:hypothetical protein
MGHKGPGLGASGLEGLEHKYHSFIHDEEIIFLLLSGGAKVMASKE